MLVLMSSKTSTDGAPRHDAARQRPWSRRLSRPLPRLPRICGLLTLAGLAILVLASSELGGEETSSAALVGSVLLGLVVAAAVIGAVLFTLATVTLLIGSLVSNSSTAALGLLFAPPFLVGLLLVCAIAAALVHAARARES
jgi:hypothetical protein